MSRKSVMLKKFGGPDALALVDEPSLPLGKRDVRIAVKAAGVNFADLMMRMGLYPEAPKTPFVPGYEVSGTIAEIGPEAETFKVGDKVCAGCRFGGYTTELVIDERQVSRFPEKLSFAEAAALPVTFITAWLALDTMARARKGDRVLIHSAAGGVGVAAVQIAKHLGAEVTGLVGSPSKAGLVRELGASEVLTTAEWEAGMDRKFDAILDPTGGGSIKRSLAHLRPGGRVICYGVGSMVGGERRSLVAVAKTFFSTPIFTPLKFMMTNTGLYGLNVLKLFPENVAELDSSSELPPVLQAFHAVMEGFQRGQYRAIVGKVFPLGEAGAAQEHLRSRANMGKVILET